jgi:hypothetical protein
MKALIGMILQNLAELQELEANLVGAVGGLNTQRCPP